MLRLVAFDMDGTLVDLVSSWQAVHEHFHDSNAEALGAFLAGAIDDEEFVRRDIVKWRRHAPDLSVFDLERILAPARLVPGARELVGGLAARGVRTAIVSGGIDLLARRIGRELGIDYVLANGFRTTADGRLTGEGIIRVPIRSKESVLAGIQEQLGVPPEETASVGNSEIDVGLFRRSRIGVAYRPVDAAVRNAATLVLEEGDLAQALAPLLAEGTAPSRGPPSEPS